MSVEEYLQKNLNHEFLELANEFKNSSEYESIQKLTSSAEYQFAKSEALSRDIQAHKNILQEIEALQKLIFTNK